MQKRDLWFVVLLGAAVGLLIQPILITLSPVQLSLTVRVAVFFGLFVLAPIALVAAHFLSRLWAPLYQFAKFAAVGVLNTFIDFGILNLLIAFTDIQSGIGFSAFKGISFLGGTTNSFFWNKFWTFDSKEKTTVNQTAKFYAIAVAGWVLNVGAASFVVNGISRPEVISPNLWANVGALVGVGASLLWNFFGYKYFVFKKEPQQVVGAE